VVPGVRFRKSQNVPVLVQVIPDPGVAVAKYEVIDAPPSDNGAAQVTRRAAEPGVNVT
jgi:hypothetical protein